jgi:phage replication-related protein YjqB (UPF0714/DUF867 family)
MLKNKIIFLFFVISFLSCSHQEQKAGSQDHYQNFTQMQKNNIEGVDYSIDLKNNHSKILVMSFHGGFIESGTTELGLAITKNDFDFYAFSALKPGEMHAPSFTSSTLHITSTHFNDPKLLKMLPEKDFCLGLHGFGGEEADFCIGGAAQKKRVNLLGLLQSQFPELKSCELCCPPYNGVSLKNPINQCKHEGVQVEMSPKVRKKILADRVFLKRLSDAFIDFLHE